VAPPSPESTVAVLPGRAGGGAETWIKNLSIVGNVFNNANNSAYPIVSIRDGTAIAIAANAINANGRPNPQGIDVGGHVVRAKVTGNDMSGIAAGREYTASTVQFKTPTTTLFLSTGGATVAAGSTVYLTPGGATANEAQALMYVPYSCFALNMMTHAELPPGGLATFTYTFRQNGRDEALRVRVNGNVSDGEDRAHVASIPSPAGPDTLRRISLKLTTSPGAAVVAHTVSVQITENE